MEFRYRAGEERDLSFLSSSSSSDGYFASQALRAGFGIGRGGLLPPAITPREALMRELQKERIREELLAREIAQKRMLEEEVRRELELERQMAMRRFQEERFLLMGEGRRYSEPGIERVMMPFDSEARVGERLVPRYLEVRADERSTLPVPHYPEFRADKRSPLPVHPKAAVGKKVPKLFSKPEISPFKDIKPLNPILSGAKRKAANELPRPARKEWSCVVCQVRTTSQEALNEHLQGRKHKAKEALLGANNKATPKKPNGSTSMAKEGDRSLHQAKGTSANRPVKKNKTEGKKQQQKTVWCDLCKLKCNSPAMLASHLGGKKHKAQLEESKKGDEDDSAATPTAEVVKEVTDQTAKGKEVEAEDNATREVDGMEAATKLSK